MEKRVARNRYYKNHWFLKFLLKVGIAVGIGWWLFYISPSFRQICMEVVDWVTKLFNKGA